MIKSNLLHDLEIPPAGETFDILLSLGNIRIERIASSDIIPETDCNQEQDEWVLLLEGEAELEIDGEAVTLARMDSLFIPAGTTHRVRKTRRGTVWLAVHVFPR